MISGAADGGMCRMYTEVHLTNVFQVLGTRCLSSARCDHWAKISIFGAVMIKVATALRATRVVQLIVMACRNLSGPPRRVPCRDIEGTSKQAVHEFSLLLGILTPGGVRFLRDKGDLSLWI